MGMVNKKIALVLNTKSLAMEIGRVEVSGPGLTHPYIMICILVTYFFIRLRVSNFIFG